MHRSLVLYHCPKRANVQSEDLKMNLWDLVLSLKMIFILSDEWHSPRLCTVQSSSKTYGHYHPECTWSHLTGFLKLDVKDRYFEVSVHEVSFQHEFLYPNVLVRRRIINMETLAWSKENDSKNKTMSHGLFNKHIPIAL